MATRPSIVPMANPLAEGKQETTRVCHFSGEVIVCGARLVSGLGKETIRHTLYAEVGLVRLKI